MTTRSATPTQVPPRSTAAPEFAWPSRVHCLGIGGAGVSGLARILAARGVSVSGHDPNMGPLAHGLREQGLAVSDGESSAAALPKDTELVVRSAAVPKDDPQVLAARERGLAVWKYAEALGRLGSARRTLAVAGTHGKTTTSWMLWHALDGLADHWNEPIAAALIGGVCQRLETNALAGSPDGWLCVEACEYDRSFLHLAPYGSIVTNVEAEHLDYYRTYDAVRGAFARFLDGTARDGLVVLGRQVPEDVEEAAEATVWRLGRELEVDLLGEQRGAFSFRLRGPGWATPPIQLGVPGHFNVENAALALGLAIGTAVRGAAGRPAEEAARAAARGLERFQGVDRRFESWGEVEGVHVVHDYAHHPTEVRVTVEAALRAFPDRPLYVLFQPHQHSRTARFLEEFAESLRAADAVWVTDVYGARLHIDGERQAGAPELVAALEARDVIAVHAGGLDAAIESFVTDLSDDVGEAAVLVIGAGDIDSIRERLHDSLALRRVARGASRT